MPESMRPLVLYHADCADGFCAAWVAHRKFGEDADYLPVQYGQEPPAVTGRRVIILDFSYKRDVLQRMADAAWSIIVLDHHKTAKEELAGFPPIKDGVDDCWEGHNCFVRFDMEKSGGRLAWEYFNPGMPSPWLVDYTEDRDLWRWKLWRSRDVSAALASHPREFGLWEKFSSFEPGDVEFSKFVSDGAAILRYQSQVVAAQCKNAHEIEIDGHKVLAVNATVLISEIAGSLAEGRPFGATYFIRADGKAVWSLRSREGGVDVSEIARRHGGGGHAQAAGFEEPA